LLAVHPTVNPPTDNLADARSWLATKLSAHRLHHSEGVYHKAISLAKAFGLSPEQTHQAAVAGLLHDAAKLMHPEALLAYAAQEGLDLDPADQASPQTLHPIIGAALVEKELGITDFAILEAIRAHTTGKPSMSLVEKVVYIADKIEDNTRNLNWIAEVSAYLQPGNPDSLNHALLFLFNTTINQVHTQGQPLHPRTLAARNSLLEEITEKEATQAKGNSPTHQVL